jgi:hypothetical protein
MQERSRDNAGHWSNWLTYSLTGTSKGFIKSTGTYQYRVKGCKSFVCSGYSPKETATVGAGACPPGGFPFFELEHPTDTKQQNTPQMRPRLPPTC